MSGIEEEIKKSLKNDDEEEDDDDDDKDYDEREKRSVFSCDMQMTVIEAVIQPKNGERANKVGSGGARNCRD